MSRPSPPTSEAIRTRKRLAETSCSLSNSRNSQSPDVISFAKLRRSRLFCSAGVSIHPQVSSARSCEGLPSDGAEATRRPCSWFLHMRGHHRTALGPSFAVLILQRLEQLERSSSNHSAEITITGVRRSTSSYVKLDQPLGQSRLLATAGDWCRG